jgi:hypothetical protein
MAWDGDEVEIERSPFMALRGLVPPSSSTMNARRTDPLESVPEAELQPRMPEPQPHKCTPGVKPDGQEDRQPRTRTTAANWSAKIGNRQAAPSAELASHKLAHCRLVRVVEIFSVKPATVEATLGEVFRVAQDGKGTPCIRRASIALPNRSVTGFPAERSSTDSRGRVPSLPWPSPGA